MSAEPDHLPPRLVLVLVGLTLAWGFNWTAMKVALAEIPPWTFRAFGLAAGSGVLFAALRAGGQPLAVPRGQWPRLLLLAFLNITCWNLLIAFGLTMIASGRASILAFTMPMWAIPLSVLLLRERITARKAFGLALGVAALVLLLADSAEALGRAPLGSLLALGAALTWALGSVLQKRYPVSLPAGGYTAWVLLLGGAPLFVGMLLFEDPSALGRASAWALAGFAYNVVIAFAWANWAWMKIATSVPVAVSSLSTLVIPVISVLSGMVFLGERPSWTEYAALGLVLAALATVLRPGRQAR